MANIVKTFTANGETETFTCSKLTVLAGLGTSNNFGGGTITVHLSHNGVDFVPDSSTLTTADALTSNAYAGGVTAKIALSGSTSPDLSVSVSYE